MEQPISVAAVSFFDDDADVVILGYGIAGACAALEARRAGGDVLVLERSSGAGGASAQPSGIFYFVGGTEVQKAAGFHAPPDKLYRPMIGRMGTEQDQNRTARCRERVGQCEKISG